MMDSSSLVGALSLLWLLGLVLVVVWIALPFAVFGIKGHLRDLIAEQRRTNKLLESIDGRPAVPRER